MRAPTNPLPNMGTPTTRAAEFRDVLFGAKTRVLVADGAMGTMLLARRALVNRSLDELNLSLPALVRDVHQEFLRAGAEILETNTFGANRARLAAFGFGDRVRAVNQAGVRIAREAAREQAFIAGAVGPLGVRLEPYGRVSREEARVLFREQTDALVYAGVDLLVLETFQDLGELEQAVLAARESAGAETVVIAEVSPEEDGRLADGTPVAEFARRMEEWPVDAIGLNCGSGPAAMLAAIEGMAGYTSKPVSAMPGVGARVSAEYMARVAGRFLRAGVRIVGGCCGVTPEHIRAMAGEVRAGERGEAASVRSLTVAVPGEAAETERGVETEETARLEEEVRRAETEETVRGEETVKAAVAVVDRSGLGAKLSSRTFVTLVEIAAPRGVDAGREIELARRAKELGVDAVVVVDGRGARLSAAVTCQLIAQQAGIEAVLPVRSGGIGELLSAHAMGIRNLLCDSSGLAQMVRQVNLGLDWGGNALGSRTELLAGVWVNPAEEELPPLEGAEFVVTRPVYNVDMLERFLDRCGLPAIVGVRPLTSLRDVEYTMHELGVAVPAEIAARMAVDPAEGIAIAREMVERVRARAAGVYWSAPFTGELH
jgi:methionine synthase I (cobalamin-dependent)